MAKRDLQAYLAAHSVINVALVATTDVGTVVWSGTTVDTKIAVGRWAVSFSPSAALDPTDDLRYKFQHGETSTGPWLDPPDQMYLPTWNQANNNIIDPAPVSPYLPTASVVCGGRYIRLGLDVVALASDVTISMNFMLYTDEMPFNGWTATPPPNDGLP
jgi:hypothetical protein